MIDRVKKAWSYLFGPSPMDEAAQYIKFTRDRMEPPAQCPPWCSTAHVHWYATGSTLDHNDGCMCGRHAEHPHIKRGVCQRVWKDGAPDPLCGCEPCQTFNKRQAQQAVGKNRGLIQPCAHCDDTCTDAPCCNDCPEYANLFDSPTVLLPEPMKESKHCCERHEDWSRRVVDEAFKTSPKECGKRDLELPDTKGCDFCDDCCGDTCTDRPCCDQCCCFEYTDPLEPIPEPLTAGLKAENANLRAALKAEANIAKRETPVPLTAEERAKVVAGDKAEEVREALEVCAAGSLWAFDVLAARLAELESERDVAVKGMKDVLAEYNQATETVKATIKAPKKKSKSK